MTVKDVEDVKAGVQMICQGNKFDEFSILATVINNNSERHELTLSRSMKYGTLKMKDITLPYSDVVKYYDIQKGIEIPYTDYCTCYMKSEKDCAVQFWDEMKDKVIADVRCNSLDEAVQLKEKWVNNAPANVICEDIDKNILKNRRKSR